MTDRIEYKASVIAQIYQQSNRCHSPCILYMRRRRFYRKAGHSSVGWPDTRGLHLPYISREFQNKVRGYS